MQTALQRDCIGELLPPPPRLLMVCFHKASWVFSIARSEHWKCWSHVCLPLTCDLILLLIWCYLSHYLVSLLIYVGGREKLSWS